MDKSSIPVYYPLFPAEGPAWDPGIVAQLLPQVHGPSGCQGHQGLAHHLGNADSQECDLVGSGTDGSYVHVQQSVPS